MAALKKNCFHLREGHLLHIFKQGWSAHAPANGGPVFPGTLLGHFWI